jgi:protein O-mannosyl-transferase
MLPVVLLLWTWWQRGRVRLRDWLAAGPFFLLALAFGLMTVWFQSHQAFTTAIVQTENFAARLAGAAWAVWFYLGKALLPLNLSAIYPRWQINAAAPTAWLPLVLLFATLLLCWWRRQTWGRHTLFALGCFVVTLFPVLGFFDMYFLSISRVSDHFEYLPLIAIVALVAAALDATGSRLNTAASPASSQPLSSPSSSPLSAQSPPHEGDDKGQDKGLKSETSDRGPGSASLLPDSVVGTGFAFVLLLTLAIVTFNRCHVFVSDESLWRDTAARNPASWTAHNNLGCILAGKKIYDQAIGEFETSLTINSQNAAAQANLGQALAIEGRLAEAEPHFLEALKLKPDGYEGHRYYANALMRQGRNPEALPHLREALRLQPDIDTRLQLAGLLYQTGDLREAVTQLRQAVALKPDLPRALNNLAWLLATASDDSVRDGADAVRFAERACRLSDYKQPGFLTTLAAAYAEAGRFPEAVTTAEMAAKLAAAAGDARSANVNQQLLELYRANKPWHEKPPTAGVRKD